MATVTLKEYSTLPLDHNGNPIPVGTEPPDVKETALTPDGTSAQTTFDERTRFCEIFTDGILNYKVGADPTATTGGTGKMAAGERKFFAVQSGGKASGIRTPNKIAIIVDT